MQQRVKCPDRCQRPAHGRTQEKHLRDSEGGAGSWGEMAPGEGDPGGGKSTCERNRC